jgi:hypothetical protein
MFIYSGLSLRGVPTKISYSFLSSSVRTRISQLTNFILTS